MKNIYKEIFTYEFLLLGNKGYRGISFPVTYAGVGWSPGEPIYRKNLMIFSIRIQLHFKLSISKFNLISSIPVAPKNLIPKC